MRLSDVSVGCNTRGLSLAEEAKSLVRKLKRIGDGVAQVPGSVWGKAADLSKRSTAKRTFQDPSNPMLHWKAFTVT